ncbi:hypothetical protein BCR42DRAFT_422798 [Absidia repens]|uniref:Uncharacterized protein n=1 Tax=Absidia repens TaxID=90262 RepID=A0A1X2I2R5_9FUNG|nr:hypothetical protein BCR42DRAFT_429756 [Absidia repens]ORZ08122.1 hypothetical protein BCR42DRAFT_425272 [Absidia repens]ORZ08124.1 hypothetical protein BCR42DRAFT_425278 [Absidia repens]ORZ08313.1 hypothetical protein BCR42DRAFT_424865 [Absidia repens]ORZ10130.1 hypothetical protein BCR42DRAFT_422791 [Absidia repens]
MTLPWCHHSRILHFDITFILPYFTFPLFIFIHRFTLFSPHCYLFLPVIILY